MGDLLIDLNELVNIKDQESSELQESALLIHAEEIILQGGKVIVEQRYSNAPPDRLEEFASLDLFRKYLNAFLTNDQTQQSEDGEPDPIAQLHNDQPDHSIYTNPDTFGTDRGTELDKAFRSGEQKEES